jgi:single-strand DNA-binding protein
MRGLNRVQLIGNVGRDPEARQATSGAAVAAFTLAVDRPRRAADGSSASEVEWFRVVAWAALAGLCQQYLRRGARVYVEGRLQSRAYTDAEGVGRVAVEVIASDLILLDRRAPDRTDAASPLPGMEEALPA